MITKRAPFLGFAVALTLVLSGCIADIKLSPAPTTEYLPCSGMDLPGERVDPDTLAFDPELWGGFWRMGDEWHIGLTDPGEVDLRALCSEISDQSLVVHEVPHSLRDVTRWHEDLTEEMAAEPDSDTLGAELTIVNGQVVVEVFAADLETAAEVTRGIPQSAWVWGGGPFRATSP